jgi:CBS domain-containing protein
MLCEEAMTKEPKCCVPTDTAAMVAKLMKAEDVGSVPVCENRHSRTLVGIITDRDLAIQVVAEGRSASTTMVKEIMTCEPFTCRPSDNLQKALDVMRQHRVRRIPVVDDDDKLVGIIAQADVATRSDRPDETASVVGEISRRSTVHA